MRMKRLNGLLVLIGSLLLTVCPVPAQEMTPATGRPETGPGLSALAGKTNDLLVQVSEAAGNAGFELQTCTLRTAAAQGEAMVEIAAEIDGFEPLRAFLRELSKERAVGFQRLSARPKAADEGKMRISVAGELVVAAGPTGQVGVALDELLKPLGDVPFFLPGSGRPDQPKLVGVLFEQGKGTTFQLVAARIEDFAAVRSRPGMPSRSQTLSQSSFVDGDLYNLDCSTDPVFPASDEMISLFTLLSGRIGTREVSMRKAADGDQLRLRLDFLPERVATLQALMAEKGWVITEADATPQSGNDLPGGTSRWSGMVTLKTKGGAESSSAAALEEWRRVFGLAWPSTSLGSLRYFWTPERSTISVQVDPGLIKRGPGGIDFDPPMAQAGGVPVPPVVAAERPVGQPLTLREAFDDLGMRFLESHPVESDQSLDSGDGPKPVVATFFRQGAGKAGVTYAKPLSSSQEKSVFPVGTVLDRKPRTDGNWYRLQVSRDQLPALLAGLAPRDDQSLFEFSLVCNPPADPEVTLVLANQRLPQAAGVTEAIRRMTEATFPWNLPMEALPEKMTLRELKVNSDGTMLIVGWTPKSSRIFSELFPALKKIPGIEEPFFREGNYRDSPQGRIMRFEVTTRFVTLEGGR